MLAWGLKTRRVSNPEQYFPFRSRNRTSEVNRPAGLAVTAAANRAPRRGGEHLAQFGKHGRELAKARVLHPTSALRPIASAEQLA